MNYRICSRCVMDTSDHDIFFNEDGTCNHCSTAIAELRTGSLVGKEGLRMLQSVADEIRRAGEGQEYDCIIGVSGGIDSSYLLHVAKKMMGLRPLAVHVDAGWNSEIAVGNIETLIKALDIDLFTYVIDWEEMKDLQLAFLKSSVANQDTPQDHAFFAKLYEFAVNNGIRYVLTGRNLATESILPTSWGYDATDKRQLTGIHKRYGRRKLKSYPTMSFLKYHVYWPFLKRMKRVSPLNYINYGKEAAIRELEVNYGWRYYGGKHYESRWTKFFQSYYLPEKFGYDKRRAHLSSMIVAGHMAREVALAELEKPAYDAREIDVEKDYIARKLGISPDELERLIQLPNKTYLDYPNNARQLRSLKAMREKLRSLMRPGSVSR